MRARMVQDRRLRGVRYPDTFFSRFCDTCLGGFRWFFHQLENVAESTTTGVSLDRDSLNLIEVQRHQALLKALDRAGEFLYCG